MSHAARPGASAKPQPKRERDQPYAAENEEYRFETVKPPTDPEERQAHGSDKDKRAPASARSRSSAPTR